MNYETKNWFQSINHALHGVTENIFSEGTAKIPSIWDQNIILVTKELMWLKALHIS
jgi:hypothetical protein